jgi:hypothetical protein
VLPKVWQPNSTPDNANWVDLDLLKQFTWGLHEWAKREYVAMTGDHIMALIHYLTHGQPFLNGFIAYVKLINSSMRRLHIHPGQVAHFSSTAKATARDQRKALRKTVMSQTTRSFCFDSQLLSNCTGKRLSMNAGLFVLYAVAYSVTTTRSGVA